VSSCRGGPPRPHPQEVKSPLPGRSVGAIRLAASVRNGTVWNTRAATFPVSCFTINKIIGDLLIKLINYLTERLINYRYKYSLKEVIN
jgi:hypothetical protein